MSNDNKTDIADMIDGLLWLVGQRHDGCASHEDVAEYRAALLQSIAALPAEKPAAAAERGAVGLTDERLWELRADAKADPRTADTHWFILFARSVLAEAITPEQRDYWANLGQAKADADQRRGVQMPVSYYIASVLGAMRTHVPLAAPPAQAAEPAQVDEVKKIAAEARDWFARFEFEEKRYREGSGHWSLRLEALNHLHKSIDRLEELAALTQRPAAPASAPAAEVFGWLIRGGGDAPVQPDDRWTYIHGHGRPVVAWTHQEVQPVYTRPAAPLATDAGVAAFHGFMDEANCCVHICYTPDHPGTDGKYATAYYTHPAAVEVPAQRTAQGEVRISIDRLNDWRERVNTIAALTLKDDRYRYGSALKREIASVIDAAPRAPEGGRADTGEKA